MLKRQLILLSILIVAVSTACASTAYEDEIAEYRKKRDERLRSDTYYLAITGMFWLEEGTNTFGASKDNDLVFPGKDVPDRIGMIDMKDGELSVTIEKGVRVTVGGEAVSTQTIYHDGDEENERTLLEMGTMNWYVIKRGPKYGIRLKDSESEILKNFTGVDCYPVDEGWRVEGRFEEYPLGRTVSIGSVIGVDYDEPCWGAVVFERDGKAHRLDVVGARGAKRLWLIFADDTSGFETYGAGRFLYIDAPDENGKVVIDFNKAYNPPCAFSPYTTCPLPPEQNLLSIKVTAGEKKYATELGYSTH